MLKIGITGGIGSGKSTVCEFFKLLGIPVFYADAAGKALMNTDAEVKSQIISLFGNKAYTGSLLDRKYIADIVFHQPPKLEALNAIIHPAVKKDFAIWSQRQEAPYVLKEAAIMFESGSYLENDYNVLVFADEKTRIKRVMERDHVDEAAVRARMAKQLPETEKEKLSDFVIYNNEDQFLITQILTLHHKFLEAKPILKQP